MQCDSRKQARHGILQRPGQRNKRLRRRRLLLVRVSRRLTYEHGWSSESTEGDHQCFRSDSEVEERIVGSSSQRSKSQSSSVCVSWTIKYDRTTAATLLAWKINKKIKTTLPPTHIHPIRSAALATIYPRDTLSKDPDSAPDFTLKRFWLSESWWPYCAHSLWQDFAFWEEVFWRGDSFSGHGFGQCS